LPTPGGGAANAANKDACTKVLGDIDNTTKKVAEAEKIGPPAGHSAVSAQYSLGAAQIYAHSIMAEAPVDSAAEAVADAMSDLADEYAKAPATAPAKTTLLGAAAKFTTVCTSLR
jgi:hypothetical protein